MVVDIKGPGCKTHLLQLDGGMYGLLDYIESCYSIF